MHEEMDPGRRRFLGITVTTVAAAGLGMTGSADAHAGKIDPGDATPFKPGTNKSFASLKQIDAGVLNVGYAEAGPGDGPAVILLHGWPYDIHSYVDVAPLLAAGRLPGDRAVSARLRDDAFPLGRYASGMVSNPRWRLDVIALMDALKIQKAIVARLRLGRAHGQHRRRALAGALQGAGLGQRLPDRQPASEQGAVAAKGGAAVVVPVSTSPPIAAVPATRSTGDDFAKLIWQIASPKWDFDDATFERSAAVVRQPGPRRHRDP